jgi:PAS domain S-box-containing protein
LIPLYIIESTHQPDKPSTTDFMKQQIENAQKEIVQLKTEARENEDKLRSFFDSSSVIHLFIDTNKRVIDFNRAAADFIRKHYGLELNQGTEVSSFMHENHAAGFDKGYEIALGGVSVRTEKMLTYHGEEIYWFLTFEPAWDKEGKIMGVSYNAVDISDKIADENKILAQYNSLKNIAAIQSHQFRKPVMNIVGLMNIFKANNYDSNREDLMMMQKAIIELEGLLVEVEEQSKRSGIPRIASGDVLWD